MSSPEAVFLSTVRAVESGPFAYALYGGLVAGLWGEPRFTEDVDLVLFLPERESYRFLRAAAKAGFSVDEDLAIQQIQVNGWARLPLGDRDSRWHLDFTLGDSDFDRSALARRREVTLFGRTVWAVAPEDLILYKLISARDRDLVDVRAVVARRPDLDRGYLATWADWLEREGIEGIRARLDALPK